MIYHLDKAEYPTIPVPHDCVIEKISLSDDFLVLDFEKNIAVHDSVQYIHPEAKSLTIKIHLLDTLGIYKLRVHRFPTYKRSFVEIKPDKLLKLVKQGRVEYLYHYVAYRSMIINLFCETDIILELEADYVEYIWEE